MLLKYFDRNDKISILLQHITNEVDPKEIQRIKFYHGSGAYGAPSRAQGLAELTGLDRA